MPYHWSDSTDPKTLTLWPHQSMTGPGFVWFIGATATMLALPLLAVLGSPVVWVLMAFFAAALAGVWRAIMANRAHRSLTEKLTLEHNRVHLEHRPPSGPPLEWEANPHWVTVHLSDKGPVESYLTLRGNGREVELGAFLTPEERSALHDELTRALRSA
jgi:uncharacterized membrane protein